jgi:hypothetical protein
MMTLEERNAILAARKAGKSTTWDDVGHADALAGKFNPPSNDRARTAYVYAWERDATDAAWRNRMTGD